MKSFTRTPSNKSFPQDTFFVGDHQQMFPHLKERVLIKTCSNLEEDGIKVLP